MLLYTYVTNVKELRQILSLQKANLPSALSEESKRKDGFVTVHHDFDILKRMNDVCPHIIAKEGEFVVGYALCMHPKFGGEIEVLRAMFQEIRAIRREHGKGAVDDFMVMGQVCVAKSHRQQGVFRKLYETMFAEIQPNFKSIITEVDVKNTRSLQAHYGIGFTLLSRYNSDGRDWELIELK